MAQRQKKKEKRIHRHYPAVPMGIKKNRRKGEGGRKSRSEKRF